MATSAATGPRAIVCEPPSRVVALHAPSKVIGIPQATSSSATTSDSGSSTKTSRRAQVEVEVAQVPVAAQPADHGQHHRQARGRRDELEPDDPAELAEVRQVLLARVVLEVRVGHERADGVEDHGCIGAGMLDSGGVLVSERRSEPLPSGFNGR